jgi:hypothetical protein
MHIHQRIELFLGGFGKTAVNAHACIIHQMVNLPGLPFVLQHGFQLFGKGGKAAHIARIQL